MSADLSLLIFRLDLNVEAVISNMGDGFRASLRWDGGTPQQTESEPIGPFDRQSEAVKAITHDFIARVTRGQ